MCSRQRSPRFEQGHVSEKVLGAVLDAAPGFHYLGLQGIGEPTLHPGLPEIIGRFRKRMPSRGRIALTTNGTLLDGDLASRVFDAGLNTVTFSVDGACESTYETRRTGASFQQVCRNIEEATSRASKSGRRDLWLGANMVVDPGNLPEVPGFVRMAG
jgi:molybdenum cofactor biosynthesis enzyme MoaA